MRKILLLGILYLVSSNLHASDKLTQLKLPELHDCYTSFWSQGHFIEMYVVYEGDRCNILSQAAALYMDGELINADDCTDAAVELACGTVHCI